jgi:enamine deaminase RidA (YjgF/YER057c/UK114 family)
VSTVWRKRFYDAGGEFSTSQAGLRELTDTGHALDIAQQTAEALARLVEELEDAGRLDAAQVQHVLGLHNYVSAADAE